MSTPLVNRIGAAARDIEARLAVRRGQDGCRASWVDGWLNEQQMLGADRYLRASEGNRHQGRPQWDSVFDMLRTFEISPRGAQSNMNVSGNRKEKNAIGGKDTSQGQRAEKEDDVDLLGIGNVFASSAGTDTSDRAIGRE